MLRILDRYVIREILPYFLLSFFLLTSIIFVHEANRFSELFVVFSQRGISSTPLLMLVISLLPSIVIFTIPISFLLGVMLAIGRLSGDSEIVVMTAGGVSPLQLLRPVMFVALIACTITAYNTFYLLPVAVNSLNQLKQKRNQILVQSISTQIKPGMFAENLPNRVLYIEQSDRASDTWKNIFIAEQEESEKDNKEPKIYTAQSGNLVLGDDLAQTELWLDHSFVYASEARKFAKQKDTMSTYSKRAVIRFNLSSDSDPKKPEPPPASTVQDLDPLPPGPDLMTLPQLWRAVPEIGKERQYQIEFYKRFALPVACLFFALIGVALGVTGTRSGRSSGLFIGLVVNLAFYLLFLGGERAARQGVLPVLLGVWGPDVILGAVSFWLFAGGPAKFRASRLAVAFWNLWNRIQSPAQTLIRQIQQKTQDLSRSQYPLLGQGVTRRQIRLRFGFPRIIDLMIFREATRHFLFVLIGLWGIFIIFTLFELINHIAQNKIKAGVVVEYLVFLTPQVINYMLPFAVLVAVLVTFGLLGRTSQLIALNTSGQSVYRLTVPVLIGALLIGGTMLASQEYVLPFTNRTQDYLRNFIRGKQVPPQTFYQTNRKWFRGQNNRIFNFRHFDTNKNEFIGLSIYETNPETASLVSRIYAKTAHWDPKTLEWVLIKGWKRTFTPDGRPEGRTEMTEARFKLPEDPEYFTQGIPESSKMSITELQEQIIELKRIGADVMSLNIELQSKFAACLACLVMALVGLPFSFTIGKRGALVGVSIGIAIAIIFWGTIGVFDQLGRYELLPPFWAAWGPNLLFSVGGVYLLLTAKT